MKRIAATALVLTLCVVELSSAYFGGWGRGHITHSGITSGCTGCIFIGTQYFWADAGDELNVDYDVTVNQGELHMWMAKMTPGNLGDTEGRLNIQSTASGKWSAPISRRGWYHLVINGFSQGRVSGYDIAYQVRWRFVRS